ncbi:MAG: DUF1127 domain-containing protein [Pseudomonadota bacterium]
MSIACETTHVPALRASQKQPFFAGFGKRLRWVTERWSEWRERRDAVSTLLRLEDRLLDDMGLTRLDVVQALGLPLHHNASQLLKEIADDRRGSSLEYGHKRARSKHHIPS